MSVYPVPSVLLSRHVHPVVAKQCEMERRCHWGNGFECLGPQITLPDRFPPQAFDSTCWISLAERWSPWVRDSKGKWIGGGSGAAGFWLVFRMRFPINCSLEPNGFIC